jgi:hypothetical protein
VFIKHHRGLIAFQQQLQQHRDWELEVFWFYGSTGTGKTREAYRRAPGAYWKDGCTKWWDQYDNQPDVILDEWRPNKELPVHYMLRLLDRYPLLVESKGGYLKFNSRRIFITSPEHPKTMFDEIAWLGDEKKDQLMRRISSITHFRPALIVPASHVPAELVHDGVFDDVVPTIVLSDDDSDVDDGGGAEESKGN